VGSLFLAVNIETGLIVLKKETFSNPSLQSVSSRDMDTQLIAGSIGRKINFWLLHVEKTLRMGLSDSSRFIPFQNVVGQRRYVLNGILLRP
jgi:hypothetical protein